MTPEKSTKRNPWFWIPSLYFAEGIPYIVVMTVSVIMYKRLGISNTDIALYTSWLYLPWVIKPLWSPIVDIFKTKRFWIVVMQLIIGAGLAGVAFTIPVSNFFQYTLAFFWLLAFSSATHDIAADGFYMIGLSKHDQAWFVGIRSTFYRLAMITGQGILVILAGYIESHSGLPAREVSVDVNPKYSATLFYHPDSIEFGKNINNLQVITYPEKVEISTEQILNESADSIVTFAKNWNTTNYFYSEEKRIENTEIKTEPSWWGKSVVTPLEDFLRTTFGPELPEKSTSNTTGNLAVVYFRLTQKPQEDVVINFGREAGDNSISLVEGARIVFNQNNWDKTALAVIQIDPKLKMVSSAMFQGRSGNIPLAWMVTFFVLAGLFVLFFVYHKFILPYSKDDVSIIQDKKSGVFTEFFNTFALFFKKDKIGYILGFLLLYRFAEAQLVKMASPFLLDAQEIGGLSLTTGQVGFVYGTVGIVSLTLGGILGGFLAARDGLKKWIWVFVVAINLPDLVYVYLSYAVPDNFFIINLCVAIEQFGYGLGFTAYMLYMIYISDGEHKTAHYAIATGFMALGMMIPGMFSGWLQEIIGYQHFFVWVCIATIPAFIVTKLIPLDAEFGKKTE
jgi:PAT family beta-lactamase induction signal transducer AmpG